MSTDWDQINDSLKPLITSGECVAWIGSGLSLSANYKDWPDTLRYLCDKCGVEELPSSDEDADKLIDKAEECKKSNPDAYHETLAELFGKGTVESRHAYPLLLKLPFKGYITTNYDPILRDSATDIYNMQVFQYPLLDISKLGSNMKPVYYIHGCARGNNKAVGTNLVLARSEFDMAYKIGGSVRTFLDSLLPHHSILFIGCKLQEPLIKESFSRMSIIHDQIIKASLAETHSLAKRYILLPDVENDEAETDENEKFSQLKINVIRYKNDPRHEEIENILRNILRTISESQRKDIAKITAGRDVLHE